MYEPRMTAGEKRKHECLLHNLFSVFIVSQPIKVKQLLDFKGILLHYPIRLELHGYTFFLFILKMCNDHFNSQMS